MASKKILILNATQIQHKIDRIAYQILEDNLDEQEIILAGIVDRGYKLAIRLQHKLAQIAGFTITLVKIDLDKEASSFNATTNIDIENCKNKAVILVDDVLNSGRTLVYGMSVFLNIPLKKIRTVVLVDRSHHLFPVTTDFTGLALATVLKEHVDVVLDEPDLDDAVYLK